MTPQLSEIIKKKAEEKFEVVPDPNLPEIILDRYEPLREAYKCGYIEAIELMKIFYSILSDDFEEYSGDRWECLSEERCQKWSLQYEIFYTTIELLTKYMEEQNK